MVRRWTDAEDYHEGMESIDSDVMDRVLAATREYEPDSYTETDVRRAMSGPVGPEGFGSLLSPAAKPMMEEIATLAREETRKHFGNAVTLFTPIYASNQCENRCIYCGFNCDNKINRATLSPEDVRREMDSIASMGLRDILILTGESREHSDIPYIGDCVEAASERFTAVGIEVYPMNTDEYKYLQSKGADYVTVFQETYDPERYAELHPGGPKRIFSYRFDAQERALRGGMRGVAFGALLGLGDFRRDAFACGMHAHLIQRRYPHAEVSFSLPRLRPFINGRVEPESVSESDLLQVSLAYRLFMPFASQTISTRERAGFRDGIVNISATRISASVSVGVGEHSGAGHGDGQFEISDPRSVDEIVGSLRRNGLQPVMADYVRP